MTKRKRNNNDDIIKKIKEIIQEKRTVYDNFVTNTKMNNMIVDAITIKLKTDVLPEDINHFTDILRIKYDNSYNLLHETSDKIKELTKKHYELLEKIVK